MKPLSRWMLAAALCAFTAAAHAEANRYQLEPLVADVPGAAPHADPNLVNGWGVAFNPNGFVWVADNGTGLSTLYDGLGNPQSLVVTIPPAPGSADHGKPTGIVFSGSSDFVVTSGSKSGPSRFLFATEDGLIAGWSPAVVTTQAIQAYPPAGALHRRPCTRDSRSRTREAPISSTRPTFVGGKIDVFDATFTKVTMPGGFVDPKLPKGFAPFNIQNVNGSLIVTYARREEGEDDETAGPGLGVVDQFDATGKLLRRIATRGRLNAPWGVALAPASFGRFGGDLLIGNFGDGTINAYDASSGRFHGQLKGTDHRALKVDGLWGMAFGNGLANQPAGTLFVAAGPDDESHGSYSAITPAPPAEDDEDEDTGDDGDD